MSYVASWEIRLCYNGTWLYVRFQCERNANLNLWKFCSTQCHYHNKWEHLVNWILMDKFPWNLYHNTIFLFSKLYLKMSSAKYRLFGLGLTILNTTIVTSKLKCLLWYVAPRRHIIQQSKPIIREYITDHKSRISDNIPKIIYTWMKNTSEVWIIFTYMGVLGCH